MTSPKYELDERQKLPPMGYGLIDLTGLADNKQYGDTITLEGKVYTNVVKARGLDTSFQKIGKKST